MPEAREINQIPQPTISTIGESSGQTPTPGPQFPSGKLNLEIGSDYLIWNLTGKQFFRKSATTAGAVADAHLTDFAVLAGHLNRLVARFGLKSGEVNLFLSLPEAMLRSFYVPVVPRNELKQVVLWEADKVFPFNLQGELFGWRIVNSVEWSSAKKFQIQAAAVTSNRVMAICDLLTAKGLQIKGVTLTALAWEPFLATVLKTLPAPSGSCVAIVRLLGNRLGVYCYHRGALEFVRENALDSTSGEGNFGASLQYLDGSAPAPIEDPQSYQNIDPESVVGMVTDDLEYYYGRFSQRTVDTIILSMPQEKHEPISKALRDSLGVNIVPAFDSVGGKHLGSTLPNIMTPASCKCFSRSRCLDLLPHQFRAAQTEKTRFKFVLYGAGLIAAVLVALSLFQFTRLAGLVSERDKLSATLENIKTSAPYQLVQSQIGEQSKWQGQLAQLRRSANEHSQILKAFSLFTPADIFLTNITMQSAQNNAGQQINSVTVSGFVTDTGRYLELRLADYMRALQGFPGCVGLQLANQFTTLSDTGKRLQFTITMEFLNCGN
jgi:Tfp pilus assembly PilM family ATPase